MQHWLTASGIRLVARMLRSTAIRILADTPNSSMVVVGAVVVGAVAAGTVVGAGAVAGDTPASALVLAAGVADGATDLVGELAGTRGGRSIPIRTGTTCGGAIPMAISIRPDISTHIRTNGYGGFSIRAKRNAGV